MMKIKIFKVLLPLAILCTMVACSPNDDSATSYTDNKLITEYNYNETETQLIGLINSYRQSIGLNTLGLINHISYKSHEHNVYMISNHVVNHYKFQERVDNLTAVLGAEKVGENIAYNYSAAQGVLNAWLTSSVHKANIEGDYTHFGLSVTTDAATGIEYVTAIFIKIP